MCQFEIGGCEKMKMCPLLLCVDLCQSFVYI